MGYGAHGPAAYGQVLPTRSRIPRSTSQLLLLLLIIIMIIIIMIMIMIIMIITHIITMI